MTQYDAWSRVDKDRLHVRWRLPNADTITIRTEINGDRVGLRARVPYAIRAKYDVPYFWDPNVRCGPIPEDEFNDLVAHLRRNAFGPVAAQLALVRAHPVFRRLDRQRHVAPPRFDVAASARIELSPNWQQVVTLDSVMLRRPPGDHARDNCEIGIPFLDNPDATGVLSTLISTTASVAVDMALSKVAQVPVRAYADSVWYLLSTPIPAGDSAWLLLRPDSIFGGVLRAYGPPGQDTLKVLAAVQFRPVLIAGPRPVADYSRRLPNVIRRDSLPETLTLELDVRADIPTMTRAVDAEVRGDSIVKAGRKITMTGASVLGAFGDTMVLRVDLGQDGEARGTLYVRGRMAYDPARRAIYLADPDYDLETHNVLLATASWLLRKDFLAEIASRATFDIGPKLDSALAALGPATTFARDGLTLRGSLDSLEVAEVWGDRSGVLATIRVRGRLGVSVDPSVVLRTVRRPEE